MRKILALAAIVAMLGSVGCSRGTSTNAATSSSGTTTGNAFTAFCVAFGKLDDASAKLDEANSIFDETKDNDLTGALKVVNDALSAMGAAATRLAAAAPADIQHEANVVARGLNGPGVGFGKSPASQPTASEALERSQAETKLHAYRKQHC